MATASRQAGRARAVLGAVATTVFLLGCGATQYSNSLNAFTGGVGATPLDDSRTLFEVEVGANAYTGGDVAHDMLRLKTAETALRNGYRYYIVLTEQNRSQMPTYVQEYLDRVAVGGPRRTQSYKPNYRRFVRFIDIAEESGGAEFHSAVETYDKLSPVYIGPEAPDGMKLLTDAYMARLARGDTPLSRQGRTSPPD